MNTAFTDYDDQGLELKIDFRRRETGSNRSSERSRSPNYRRGRTKGPVQHSGIHRRRRARISW